MRIASVSEDQKFEKRIAISLETAKKYIALGLEVSLSENYAEHLGVKDNEYKELGVKISKDIKEVISSADTILQFRPRTPQQRTCLALETRNLAE